MVHLDAYGRAVDVSVWFDTAKKTGSPPDWSKMNDVLYHQGDIDTASYAVVPLVVPYLTDKESSWEPFALIAAIEEARLLGRAPAIPAELKEVYHDAIASSIDHALRAFPHASDALLVRSIIAVLSVAKGQVAIATFALLDQSEQAELLSL
ncbi:hypothetical protein [Rhizobium leguminosarum]|uniref:hypothetical protein n=1 Tax=Rhizobium leguminosarum TaxID=384 RepID=UPI0013D9F673|nr:hypothetical protein [Rhizobium leguminosarum]